MDGFKSDGRRNIRSFTGKTQKEAKEKRDEYFRKKAAGLLTGQDMRFDEWADYWFENHKDNITATTQESYKYTLRILKDHFGRRKLAEIKAMDIEQFLKKLRRDGRSDSALAQCRRMLFQIFNKAVANDLVMKNPGTPCNPSHFAKQFKLAVGSVKDVRVLTPHCCRHTYVSQMQAMGVSVETIQSIVGHADMDLTRHYLHVQENIRQEAVDRFSEAFSRKGRGTFGNVLDYIKSS